MAAGGGALGAIKAGAAYVTIGADDKQLAMSLAGARAKMKAFGAAVSGLGRSLMLGGLAVIAPVGIALKKFSSYGDQIAKMARRTGISAEKLSEFGYAAELSGASIETFETGLRRMARVILDAEGGLKESKDALTEVGLASGDLLGLSMDKQFELIASGLYQIKDASKKAALAQELFGRSGMRLIPLIDAGPEGFKKMAREARKLGIVLDAQTAAEAEQLTDDFTRMKMVLLGMAVKVGSALMPMFMEFAEWLKNMAGRVGKWIDDNRVLLQSLVKIAGTVLVVGAALLVLGKVIGFIGLLLSPAGIIGVVIASLLAVADIIFDLGLGFGDLLDTIKVGGHSIKTWVLTTWLAILQGWESVKSGILTGWKALTSTASIAASYITQYFTRAWLTIKIIFLKMAEIIGIGMNKIVRGAIDVLYYTDMINESVRKVMKRFAMPVDVGYIRLQQKRAEKERTRIAKEQAAKRKRINQDYLNDVRALDQNARKKIVGVRQRIDEEYVDEKRREAARRAKKPVVEELKLPEFGAGIGAGVGAMRRSVFGTYSARAAAGFGGGGMRDLIDVEKQSREKLVEIAENTKASGGLAR